MLQKNSITVYHWYSPWLSITIQLLLLLLSITSVQSASSEILDGPHSVNTTLNRTVNFTCLVTGGPGTIAGLIWLINGEPAEHYPPLSVDGENTRSYFELEASLSRNGSNISFVVITNTGNVPSDSALLLIQGVLDPPSWSSVEFNGNNLTLQWDRPHTLHNVPIMGYRVTVQSTTVIISDNTTSSLTMENIGSSNCTNVEASISALNSVGYSVTNTRTILHPGEVSVPNVSTSLQYSDGGSENDMITLQMNASVQFSCHGIIPLSVLFTVQSLHDNSASLYTITNNTILNYNSTSTNSVMIRSGDIDSIAHDTLYQVDLSIEYEGGRDVIKDITRIDAFDTQTIEIGKSTSGKLCIRCLFLSGTSAKGCLIHAKLNGINLPAMPSLINDMESLSEWACSSNAVSHNETYQITVFDIESDQTTTEVLSINEQVDSVRFNSLSIVIDDTPTTTTTSTVSMATSSTTNIIITSTTQAMEDYKLTSTQVTTSTSITSGSSPSSYVTNTVDNSMVVVEEVGQQSSSTVLSTTLVIVISVVGVVIILLLLVTIVGILGCVITQRRRKVMFDRRHRGSGDDMLMSVNTVYGSDVMTTKPTSSISANDDTHIYSEIHDVMKTSSHYVLTSKQNQCYSIIPPLKDQEKGKDIGEEKKDKDKGGKGEDDEWIPNPTYQLAPFSNNNIPPPTPTCIIDTNVDHDDDREDKVSVEVCPAYGSAPPRPLIVDGGEEEVGGIEKVVYEDLNHIV